MQTRKARLRIRKGRGWEYLPIEMPTDEEIQKLADRLHSARVQVTLKIQNWDVRYKPSHNSPVHRFSTDDMMKSFTRPVVESKTVEIPASFEIRLGDWLGPHWRITASWSNGHDQPPIWFRQFDNVLPPLDHVQGSLFDEDSLSNEATRDEAVTFAEGATYVVGVTKYERCAEARRLCLALFGARCLACGMDFGATYGELAEGIIHVHHTTPLAAIGDEYEVDPATDLVPLCPNCHSVAHLREPPYSLDELRSFLDRQKSKPI